VDYLQSLNGLHTFISHSAFVTAGVQLIFVFNLVYSLWKGPKAPKNPWNCTTLEWICDSPPVHDNFGGVEPEVFHSAYEYSVPGAKEDFVMQNSPEHVPDASHEH